MTHQPTTAAQRQAKYRSRTKRRHEQAVIDAFADGYDKGYIAGMSFARISSVRHGTTDEITPDD